MKKILSALTLSGSLAFAGLVNGIAVIVNNEPITLYDIDKKMEELKGSKQQALDAIIDQMLYEQELKKNHISVDIFDVDDYIAKLAAQNNMNLLDFKSVVSQQQDYNKFKEQIKMQLKHQKLIRKISAGKLKIVDDNDIKIYYENNKDEFTVAKSYDVIAYVSKSKQLLEQIQQNPMMNSNQVMVQNLTLKQEELNPQVKYILNSSSEKNFTAIFAQNQNYNMFFISSKNDVELLSLNSVKESIFQKMMKEKEDRFLKEYFESLKITAEVQILR